MKAHNRESVCVLSRENKKYKDMWNDPTLKGQFKNVYYTLNVNMRENSRVGKNVS